MSLAIAAPVVRRLRGGFGACFFGGEMRGMTIPSTVSADDFDFPRAQADFSLVWVSPVLRQGTVSSYPGLEWLVYSA